MRDVTFVVPAAGRVELTEVCLQQLRRTCQSLAGRGLEVGAVVVAEDDNALTAEDLGFDVVRKQPRALGEKYNDGFEFAGKLGSDFVMPVGSDDWIDADLVVVMLKSARPGTLVCAKQSAMVNEAGTRLAMLHISYPGGIGLRLLPCDLLEKHGFRPATDGQERGIDTDVWNRLRAPVRYVDVHPLQIVDFKTVERQLNTYAACLLYARTESDRPWEDLLTAYPEEAVGSVRSLYAGVAA